MSPIAEPSVYLIDTGQDSMF